MFFSASKFFVYASLFCVVIVMTSTFFPFIGGKDYFFRVSVELALAFFLLGWAFEPGSLSKIASLREVARRPLFIAVTVFAVAFLLATLFAHDMNAAFWSNYERGEGGFQMLHYYAFFVLLLFLFRRPEDWKWLFYVALAAAALMILYGVASAVFILKCYPGSGSCAYVNPFNFAGAYRDSAGQQVASTFLGRIFSPSVRFQGSLGNPAYVAPYLMFTMFYALYLLWSGKPRMGRTILFGGGVFLAFLFTILTQTRGALIGLIAATAVFFLYAIAHAEGKIRVKITVVLWALVLLCGVCMRFYTSFSTIGRIFDFGLTPSIAWRLWLAAAVALLLLNVVVVVKKWPRILAAAVLTLLIIGGSFYAVRNIQHFGSVSSFETRLWTWGSALQAFKERPLFGWGPENFSTAFDKYFNPRHFIPGKNAETWFDRAHSVVFDYLAETGIIGFVSYAAIFFVLFRQLTLVRREDSGQQSGKRENMQHHPQHQPVLIRALFAALPVGYLVQGLALFDVLPIYLNLFIFLAFSAWWFSYHQNEPAN